jgi:hypothetical protein
MDSFGSFDRNLISISHSAPDFGGLYSNAFFPVSGNVSVGQKYLLQFSMSEDSEGDLPDIVMTDSFAGTSVALSNVISSKTGSNIWVFQILRGDNDNNGSHLQFNYTGSTGVFSAYDISLKQILTQSLSNYIKESLVSSSEWTPYITTIGLYDDQYNHVATAKLNNPIKNDDELALTFIIKLDV